MATVGPRCSGVPRGMDDGFHVIEVTLERPLAGGGQAVLGLRQAADEGLVALDVTGLFELARVHAEIAVGGAQQALQVVEAQPLVHGQRRDDPQPHALVDQAVELESGAGGAAFRGRRARGDGAMVPVAREVAVLGGPGHELPSWSMPSSQPPWRLAMNSPKSRFRPPNPAARKASPQPAGANSAAPPSAMNPRPMIGTMRTENAPPVTTAVP